MYENIRTSKHIFLNVITVNESWLILIVNYLHIIYVFAVLPLI